MSAGMMLRNGFAVIGFAALAAVGCSSGGSDDDPGGDNPGAPDAGSPPPPAIDGGTTPPPPPPPPAADAAPFACTLSDDYGDLGAAAEAGAFLSDDGKGNPAVIASAPIAGSENLFVEISLWQGYGAFADTTLADLTTPLTVPIAGDEASLATCGACALVVQLTDAGAELFPATAGSITITALDPTAGTGTITASIADVSFAHVDAETLEPVGDDCNTRIGAASLTATIEAPDAP